MLNFNFSPYEMISSPWKNKSLIFSLIKREIIGRYRGSMLGILWSFFNPVFMLMVYTFVFSVVFKARWSGGGDSKSEFALVLFAGLIVFNLFAECFNRAPNLILSNVNYVKKVVFPLEILPWVSMGSALFHTLISIIVWLLFYLIVFGVPHITFLLFPLALLPLIFIVLGLSWILAALGVYLRDVSQLVSVLTTVLMFLSPIFYPISALPIEFRSFLDLNPLASAISQMRDLLYFGVLPSIESYALYLIVSIITAWLGFAFFQKTRKGFADVL